MASEGDQVMFDILLHSAGSGRIPHSENVQDFYASPDDIEHCRRWFADHNMILHATPFGLSGSAPRNEFEAMFAADLVPIDTLPGELGYKILIEPKSPQALRDLIDQISVTSAPALFE
jgi:hypothetical protein